ncbi:hypothetical protein [Methanolacinia paynteri]|uniref:hypothetical protein n=1 Tax=Methanolacinia paynteri TaxID=230356 RepID=UPI00064F96D3|nr:hypothetical protein [Methanolacinia paynteri]
MEWVIELSGNNDYLNILSEVEDFGDFIISKNEQTFILKSDKIKKSSSYNEIKKSVDEFLEIMNAACKINTMSNSNKIVANICSDNENKKKNHYIEESSEEIAINDSFEIIVTRLNGTTDYYNSYNPAIDWLKLGMKDPLIKQAFDQINYDFESWGALYKIPEIIQESVGNIPNKGWCSKKDLARFKRTACSFEALGVESRHANKSAYSPKNPMTISEAKSFIMILLENWKNEKLKEYNIEPYL